MKKCYVTAVNEAYKGYMEQLIKSHKLFCENDLIIFTINFEISNFDSEKIIFKKYFDNNLLDYEKFGSTSTIKNEYEKHKYTTLLKPLILKESLLEDYDNYLFIDCDGLLTKNSDVFFNNLVNESENLRFPISVKYFYQYSTGHSTEEFVFNDDGTYNIKSAGYYPLIDLYNTDYHIIDYVSTYCLFYNKYSLDFINEVIDICFDPEVISDYKKYLPMGDETVFNYLYSKYNFSTSLCSHLCYDVSPFMPLADTLNNIEKSKDFVSFIHTKRYITDNPYGKNFSVLRHDEYELIFNILLSNNSNSTDITLHNIEKNQSGDVIYFSLNREYVDFCRVKIISLFRPLKEYKYSINFSSKNIIFFVVKENDVWVRDTNLLIEQNLIIKDNTKIF